jgi:alpha-galactosidase/6-phospho-beta-glucosidase family protein
MQKAIKEGRQPTDGDFIACSERTKADIFGVHEAPVSNHFDHSMIAFYASNGDPRAQELLSQMKKAGLMLPSPQDIEHSRRTHERFVQFVQRAMPTSSSGADDQRAKMVEDTRRRLADIKDAAAKGDKSAQNKWSNAQANYKKAQARAAKGDGRSKELASMLNDTGLVT